MLSTTRTCSGVGTTYSYDALGQRLATSVGGAVTRFVWRGGHVVFETDGGGIITRSYTWGEGTDDLVAIHDHQGGGHYYVVQDRLRAVRALVTSAGTWQAAWRYRIYGTTLSSAGAVPFPVRFLWAGAQWDAETGLYSLRRRTYDPALGRFLQEDPAGYAASANLYAYTDGDPTTARDPSGLEAVPDPVDTANPWACLGTLRGCGGMELHEGGYGGGGGFNRWDILTNAEKGWAYDAYVAAYRAVKDALTHTNPAWGFVSPMLPGEYATLMLGLAEAFAPPGEWSLVLTNARTYVGLGRLVVDRSGKLSCCELGTNPGRNHLNPGIQGQLILVHQGVFQSPAWAANVVLHETSHLWGSDLLENPNDREAGACWIATVMTGLRICGPQP